MQEELMKIRSLISLLLLSITAMAWGMPQESLRALQEGWAQAKYETPVDKQKESFKALVEQARQLAETYPDDAEAKVWLAIVLSSDAGVNGGLSALGKVKEARQLLEAAEKINPNVLDGSVYTSLGSLYYMVPGWPLSFGNDDKAEQNLHKALEINPDGIDPNYFYGDFLLKKKQPEKALSYLQKAKAAPARPNRPLADKGRQAEVDAAIEKAGSMLKK
jgi:tetratricopeptide (TPR) repeat protein